MVLTDIAIRKAKPKSKPFSMTDGGGLYLSITPSGGKLWRWSYRFNGERKLMSLGRYPHVSLTRARELHFTARSLHATGVDPMAERKARKITARASAANSFST